MNVSKENLGRVVLLLPSLKAPTISALYKDEWFDVDTIVDRGIVRDFDSASPGGGRRGHHRIPPQQGLITGA